MNEKYKVAIYMRTANKEKKNLESKSIINQRKCLLDYLNKHNDLIFVDEYIDDGYSGANFDRPGWKKLMKDIEDKKINMVITTDLARVGRNYIEVGYYIEKVFTFHNIRYIAVNDEIDSLELLGVFKMFQLVEY